MTPSVALLLARGGLAANALRLALTLACIALGVALAGAVNTVHSSALAEIDRAARALAGAADLEVRGPRSGFDDALFAMVAARPEIAAASPIVEVEAAVEGASPIRVLGIDPFRAVLLQPAFIASAGSTAQQRSAALLDAEAVWLSPRAATRLQAREGSKVKLVAADGVRDFRVGGMLPDLHAGGEVVVMDIAAAQRHFGRLGTLSRIDLRVRPGVDDARLRAELARVLPPGVVLSPAASISGRAAEITRAYRVNLDALSLVALATGAFLVFSTLALQAARRRQEFALLRALGVTRLGLAAQLAFEGAIIGAAGAAVGTALGLAGSRLLLERSGADLGAGYFAGHSGAYAPDPWALAGIALLGIAMSVAGSLWVARAVMRIPVAEALRDRAVDLPRVSGAPAWIAVALAAAGVPLLLFPPMAGLPLGGYAAIALWLAAAVALVAPLCRALLGRLAPEQVVETLALAQVRELPGHLAASVAGIVVSAALCVAMAIMVHSFRVTLEDWLTGVVGADLYARATGSGDGAAFALADQERVAALGAVAGVEPLRYDRLAMGPREAAPLSLVARPVTPRVLAGFQAEPATLPPRGAVPPVWISEAARDLHGWKAGDAIRLPIAGRLVDVRVAGLVRDYARTWGAVLMDPADYRAITGDTRANDLAIHLRAGTDPLEAQRQVRAALASFPGLVLEDAVSIRRQSLAIFDRSFAVTYALEAIAILIGLAGVTSSFAALAWSRRREFGVLRFLGLTRREILRMLALEGAAAGALGAFVGLLSGAAISLVLIHVVNRQSFHWSIEVHWPWLALAALCAGIVATCAVGARVSGALAVRHEAILAVKDDA
ncbi:MAG TPA: FtsX-like permease family protein [Usitatibacter sp.]|nr:FtsX-like permease family protein [Usitatibacter sp.]